MLMRQLIQLLLIQHIFMTARPWKCRKMSTRKPATQRLSIYAKGFSRIIDCISLHILDEYLNRKKVTSISLSLRACPYAKAQPAGCRATTQLRRLTLSGTSIKRKCHESVMSIVMSIVMSSGSKR
jgi:hypothetical protein